MATEEHAKPDDETAVSRASLVVDMGTARSEAVLAAAAAVMAAAAVGCPTLGIPTTRLLYHRT
jgi:hypothetical protein